MNDTLEIIDLESLSQEDIHCEADHTFGPVCTVEVVYIGSDCQSSLFLCKSAVDGPDGIREQMTYVNCERCLRPADVCWKVRPI